MVNSVPDLTGQRFGRLIVIKRVENKGKHVRWLAKCDCGNFIITSGRSLRSTTPGRNTRSCGCLRVDIARKNSTKHGKTHTRLYRIWSNMKRRCNSEQDKDYKNYGGRGIKVCEEWKNDFIPFYNWAMSNGYRDDLTIDRIDFNGNYEPSNCRWATTEQQGNNTRINVYITYKGKTQSLKMWSKELKLGYWMLLSRYQDNPEITPEELFRPKVEYLNITYQGKTQSILQWCKELGYPIGTIYGRYSRNKDITPEELLRPPRSYPKGVRKKNGN